ncbi:MAG TPA: sodium:solute symporter, partial [Blastocatellia bacterium]|nr:sodium:solute symporter [Blastocatellia bacterium]
MGFSAFDYLILIVYLIGVTLFGVYFRRTQSTIKDYFLGSRNVSWVVIGLSIVATETSTLTLIGVPALAYSTYARPEQGGNFTYIQVVIGYIIGRVIVSLILIPAYFKGECSTAYELLGRIFGPAAKRVAAGMFLVMRALAEGVRVFAASLVLSAVLAAGLSGLHHLWLWSILIVGALTLIYTFEGGISAVIWTDLIQLIIYIGGALIATYELIHLIPGGWTGFVATAGAAGKFKAFSFSADITSPFTFWGGVVGGTFFTLASHGTDQLIVQRLLASRSRRDSQKALILSGVVVFLQFALFLGIGTMLFAYYTHVPLAQPLATSDQVFPTFIVQRLPHGIAGLVIAAIFAAAMSNLSGSLNALSSSTLLDLYQPVRARKNEEALLRTSRWFTAA